jgi:SpoVK/Ycf46/Vps4 family AAA+-type ATPase
MIMFSNSNDKVHNIRTAELVRTVSMQNNQSCTICIKDAFVGTLDGKNIYLDELLIHEMIRDIVKAISKNQSKYNPAPVNIIIEHTENKKATEAVTKEVSKEDNNIIECITPRVALEQVYLNEKTKKQVLSAIAAVKNRNKLCDEWGFEDYLSKKRAVILNFYGKPGTGKSMTAEAIAYTLGKKVYSINYADLESKYVGETPKNIKKAFEIAKRDDAVLVFEEADSFLGKRLTSVTQSADYGVNITRSVLLLELERYEGVVIFTTNLLSNYDDAFKRRILANILFEYPNEETKEKIWKLYLNDKIPLEKDITIAGLAKKYNNISGADIKDIVFYAAINTLELQNDHITWEAFDYSYQMILQRYINDTHPIMISDEIITEEQYLNEKNHTPGGIECLGK